MRSGTKTVSRKHARTHARMRACANTVDRDDGDGTLDRSSDPHTPFLCVRSLFQADPSRSLLRPFPEVNKLPRDRSGPYSPFNLSSLEFFATFLPVLLISLLVRLSLNQRALPCDSCSPRLLFSRSLIHLSCLTRACPGTSFTLPLHAIPDANSLRESSTIFRILVLLKIFLPLVSTDFAISFLVTNFTIWLQLFIKVFSLFLCLNLSFSLTIWQKDSSFRPFFYQRSYRFHLNISFHFDYFVSNLCFFVTTCSYLFLSILFSLLYSALPFSDFSLIASAINIVRAIITSWDENICAYCYTFIIRDYSFIPQPYLFFFSLFFIIYVSSHLRIYSVYFERKEETRILINLASPIFLFYISLRFSPHFSFNSPSLTVSILLSTSPSFSSSAVTAFLYLLLPHALLHYNSLALFASIHARSVFPHFCLKTHPLSRLCISCSFPLPLVRPCIDSAHLCFAFRVFLRLFPVSHFLGPSFPFRRLALPSPRSPSPSVSACSNMATRCPITRLVHVYSFSVAMEKRSSSNSARHAVLFSVLFLLRCDRPFILIHRSRTAPHCVIVSFAAPRTVV